MSNIKFIATIGKNSSEIDDIKSFLAAGVSALRVDFTNNNVDDISKILNNIELVRKDNFNDISVIIDLEGPSVRLCGLENMEFELKYGETFTLVCSKTAIFKNNSCGVSYENLHNDVEIGDKLSFNNGEFLFSVNNISENSIKCIALNDCILKNGTDIKVVSKDLSSSTFTFNDRDKLSAISNFNIDIILVPFIKSKEDILKFRNYLDKLDMHHINLISKISELNGISNIDDILKYSNGILIDTFNLSLYKSIPEIAIIQDEVIKKCNLNNKLSMTYATLSNSLISYPVPTRHEASYIQDSILSGVDSLILTFETEISRYPLDSLKILKVISDNSEVLIDRASILNDFKDFSNINYLETLAFSVCDISNKLQVSAILSNGSTVDEAFSISKYKPNSSIVAFSNNIKSLRLLKLKSFVNPIFCDFMSYENYDLLENAKLLALNFGFSHKLDTIVSTSSLHNGLSNANLFKIETI